MQRWKNYWKLMRMFFWPSSAEAGKSTFFQRFGLKSFVFVFTLIVISTFVRLMEGELSVLLPSTTTVLAAVTLVAISLGLAWWQVSKLTRLFHQSDAQVVAGQLRKMMSRGFAYGGRDLFIAVQCAITYALYGSFEQARRELSSVAVPDEAPMLLSELKVAHGVIALLEENDGARARALFTQALRLMDLPDSVPGVQLGKRNLRRWIAIATVVEGSATEADLAEVQLATGETKKVPLAATAAWALAVDAYRRRDVEAAKRMIARVDALAPHCTPVHQLPAEAVAPTT